MLGLAALGVGLWALMNYSSPSAQLEPYTKFKETGASQTASGDDSTRTTSDNSENKDKPSALEERTDLVQSAVSVDPPPAPLSQETTEHLRRGMRLAESNQFEKAQLEFEKAAELSPNSPEVFAIWGSAFRMQKKYKGANKRFARALELAPNNPDILFSWGMSRLEERNPDEAIKLFQKTIKLNPTDPEIYHLLGKAYGQKKMYEKEAASYVKALEINPDHGWSQFNLGIVLSLQKKFEEAAPHFERAIEIDKQFEKPFVVQMLTALGRYKSEEQKSAENKKEEPGKEQTAKADADKKSEGSDHNMEGSKTTSPTTNVKGVIRVNGEPLDSTAVVLLETTNKLKVAGQKQQNFSIRQNNLQFVPQNSVVQAGSTVTFINEDREVHNIFSKSLNNQFNLGAMAAGTSKTIKFSQAGPVVLRCNLHKDMIGTLFVAPNGYYTRPNNQGEYSFEKVASRDYLMQVWHPRLYPAEIEANTKEAKLTGVDQTIDFEIQSASKPGEVHDLVDQTDYKAIVDNIEKEMYGAITAWKEGKKFLSRKRMLMAITKHFDGEGLKGALAKSFSEKRSLLLEKKLDGVRKKISGIGVSGEPVTEEALKNEAKLIISQLRQNVRELQARMNPDS